MDGTGDSVDGARLLRLAAGAKSPRYDTGLSELPPMPSPRLRFVPQHPLAAAVGGAALLLLAAAVAEEVWLRGERSELVETARELGVDRPELVREIRHMGDGARARLAVAGALLAAELGPAEEVRDPDLSRRRLEAARHLASSTLAERPASWQAATLAGSATYLAWSGSRSGARDPRLLQEHHRWEEPLLLARRLAPERDEPVRALVSAYVELWPALSDDKRRLARELAGRALRHRQTFDRLIGPWLAAAGTGPEALAVIPDEPWAWERIAATMVARADWSGLCEARDRRRDALDHALQTRLDAARVQLDQGQILAARAALLGLVAAAPTEPRYADVVDAALRTAPPGPPTAELIPALRSWLRWQLALTRPATRASRPLTTRSDADGLSHDALARLRSAAFPGNLGTDDLPLAARATLALGGPDAVQRAERIERMADDLWSEPWGIYFVEKASALARSGHGDAARAALDRVHPTWLERPVFLELAARLSEAPTPFGSSLDGRHSGRWSGTAWSWNSPAPVLEMLVGEPAEELLIAVAEAPAAGAAVEVRLDGGEAFCRAVGSGDTITLEMPISAGPHSLQLVTVAGERVWPGPVELR